MRAAHFQKGATLIEALVAVLIFSIGVLAVIGLQAVAVQTVSDAKYRADASFLANAALGRMWGNPANLDNYVETDTPINDLPNGKRTVEIAGNKATVTIKWQSPQDAGERTFVAVSYINVNN